jgi:NAD-dependent SIR2 family protein deacetylase
MLPPDMGASPFVFGHRVRVIAYPRPGDAANKNENMEVVMATVASLRGSTRPVICQQCGEALIAPEWVEYFSEEQLVLNLWTCARCGHRFETEAFLPANTGPDSTVKVPEAFPPRLVVA